MPHTASAKKRLRQNVKRHTRNKAAKSKLATKKRGFVALVAAGDAEGAAKALREAQKTFDQAGAKRTVHKKNASRKVSRMAKQLAAMKTAKAAPAK
jgi:small subunit ribosomal protein S20